MGEVQEQRYICKICSKSCVSGKSLGGHMRVHLAVISASKKAAQEKAEIKMDSKSGDDDDDDQDCSGFQNDENVNYELRENPKKSWRIDSDPKHGLSISNNIASCKECGKEFSSLRALSGHMRSHSIKNKKAHPCKKCGKGFDSMRAMFGHMKSHSKRLRVSNESAESLSELENLCPVRKKRSTIRYKSASNANPCVSSLNESNSDVFELGRVEMEEVAKSLIMLSRGVRDWSRFDSVITESSDDDSVYFGVESSCKTKKFFGNVCEFVGVDSKFVADDELLSVAKIVELEKLNDFAVKLDCANELDKDVLVDNGMNEDSSEYVKSNTCNKVSSSVQESGFEQNSSENEANPEKILEGSEEKPEFKCRTFDKIFRSHCALGGHKLKGNSSFANGDSKLDQLDCGENQSEQENVENLEPSKSKEHECPICFKVFPSGQALGGHKRVHYNESKNQEAVNQAVNQEAAVEVSDLFDLNFPVTVDEGIKRDVGLSLWWTETSLEHEALVLTH